MDQIGPYMTVHLWQVDNIEQLVLEQDVPFEHVTFLTRLQRQIGNYGSLTGREPERTTLTRMIK
ncbi:hypothetical protein STEG23_010153, partial [Scotinomys teguina]